MTQKYFHHILFLLFFFSPGWSSILQAQTFRATVSVQAERLQPEDKAILTEVPQRLMDYINNYTWSTENQNIIIESRISIIIETANRRGTEVSFQGQLIITSLPSTGYRRP